MAENRNKLLVWGADDLEKIPEQLLACVEPVFPVSESVDLRFPRAYQALLMDYFCHRIARQPQDLRSHVRRIFLAYESDRSAELFAALLDLFIALGRKGADLRARMLEFSRSSLSSHAYKLLREALPGGLDATKSPFAPGSLLSQGIEGTLQCVYSAPERVATPRDPLVEAREYLEYSQLDEARAVLERAVLDQSQPPELHRELLEIYRSTRDQGNFAKTFRELDQMANPVPEEWQKLAEFFRSLHV